MALQQKPRRGRALAALVMVTLLVLLVAWGQPLPTLSAGPEASSSSDLSAPGLSATMIYTVNHCPADYEKTIFSPGQIVYLHGTGFQPYQAINWEIRGMPGSCDPETVVAHSRMVAGWNGSFCIYCYTVPRNDCGTYRLSVNGVYHTYYDVPWDDGPTITPTNTPKPTPTVTPTVVPVPYIFTGYVYEEELGQSPSLSADPIPLEDVTIQLYTGRGDDWTLAAQTQTTKNGWFSVKVVSPLDQPRFRVVEVDPEGYLSLRVELPPLFAKWVDDNTVEMRPPYDYSVGPVWFYDYKADPTETPTATPTLTGTPPTPTATATEIPLDKIVSVTLQQGVDDYEGVEDTYISSWYLWRNYGRDNRMSVRSGDQMSPMLRFDLSFVPPNSRVLDAKLSLYVPDAGVHPMQARAFRIFRPWEVYETNWIEASAGYKWAEWGCNSRGVDRSDDYEDEQTLDEIGQWYTWDVTGMAQAWIEAEGQNQGVILRGFGDIAVQHNFHASEYWMVEYRPKLDITYAIGPATPTFTPTRRPTSTPTNTPTATPTWFIPLGDTK